MSFIVGNYLQMEPVLKHGFIYKLQYYIYYLFISRYPPLFPIYDAHSLESCSDTSDPASDPIAPPTNEPTAEPMLLLSAAVPLPPDAISVNTQHFYVRYKIFTIMNINVMVL